LVPFARRGDNDDIVYCDIDKDGRVQRIHDFASSGWEQRKYYFERAKSKGYVVGSDEYIDEIIAYVQPRDIPPSVVENAILSTKPFIGNKPGTLTYITDDIKVITDFSGKVITVMKQ
jgi:hypothetical protein